ncbi:Mitogen-activated protein kinase kinase kinase 5 [Anopheles sinensis]|uniref:Mitogen-activated protein kinase kinase kinase 5 n=1 Tax=Anopheles sinensis TaxID=74873 RepID=A0A084VTI5_ANOSI|nr:Mitogen-activated protein kinase kinase kinase 5 [Anopheles sinensis]
MQPKRRTIRDRNFYYRRSVLGIISRLIVSVHQADIPGIPGCHPGAPGVAR